MKISEFLSKGTGIDFKIDADILKGLTNDFGVPSETVEFLGASKSEYTMFSETSILYRFSKSSKGLGDCLKYLGTLIKRIPLKDGVDLGIQEIDPTQSDGYYILFYLLEGVRDKTSETNNE